MQIYTLQISLLGIVFIFHLWVVNFILHMQKLCENAYTDNSKENSHVVKIVKEFYLVPIVHVLVSPSTCIGAILLKSRHYNKLLDPLSIHMMGPTIVMLGLFYSGQIKNWPFIKCWLEPPWLS